MSNDIDASSDLDKEEVTLDDFDFIHLVCYDIHGVSKGRLMSRKSMDSVMKRGMGLYTGFMYMGIRGDPPTSSVFLEDVDGNKYLRPIMSTLRRCQSSAGGGNRIGEVMCQLIHRDGRIVLSAPREVALAQLETLKKEFGLNIKSSFELEFGIVHSESRENFGHNKLWGRKQVLDRCQDVLVEMAKDMKEGGVNIHSFLPEYGPGQWELTLDLADGIKAADDVAKFKDSSIAFLESKGLERVLMTAPNPGDGCCNGFHYNVSLWTQDGTNALLDISQPDKLSTLGQHFLAGILEHAPAMTALCCPTINCYRRIGIPWSPSYANWATQDRMVTFRLKIEPGDNIYIENRLPSSACNPYLVLASTMAAGMDGIRRKLPLPKPKDETLHLPKTLPDALAALEEDKVMITALGDLVEYFITAKRAFEIEPFKAYGNLSEGEKLEKEREFYKDHI